MLLAMCSCSAKPGSSTEQKPDPTPTAPTRQNPIASYERVQTVTWARVADKALSVQAKEYILLNFGLKIEEKNFASQNMSDKIMQLYSANIAPELSTGISLKTVKNLAERDLLCELYGQKDSLKDYFALWDSEKSAWEYTQKDILFSNSNGENGLYCLVPVNRKTSKAWIYNKTLFEENSMKFPSTLSELYDTLARYKEEHKTSGAVWTNRYEPLQFTAILNAYGLTDEAWQTDENSDVFYLYSRREWYSALEWLTKFEKIGAVPTDEKNVLTGLDSKTYNQITASSGQIIEFTDSYNYIYIQAAQKGNPEWSAAPCMIRADENTKPVILANLPYINEATCISSSATAEQRKQILFFINWCCTDEGNMWANFGCAGEGYSINENGEFAFLKHYSDEVTPNISSEKSGSISDITIGRMFTTVPWDTINVKGLSDRYSIQNEFLKNADVRLAFPQHFNSAQSVTEDKTLLWQYTETAKKLKSLTDDFIEFSRQNGFSDYFWNKYYNSLVEAGLEEYTLLMQKRKL